MEFKDLTASFTVSPQIRPGDLKEIAARGFRMVINNRPDGEMLGQPTSDQIEQAAREAGLAYVAIPIRGGQVSDCDLSATASAIDQAQGKVFAFCRSGTRSTFVWALTQSSHEDPARLIEQAGQAGYDLSPLREAMVARYQA